VGMESDVSEKIFPEGANESYDEPLALSSGGAICLRAAWRFLQPSRVLPRAPLFLVATREYFNAR